MRDNQKLVCREQFEGFVERIIIRWVIGTADEFDRRVETDYNPDNFGTIGFQMRNPHATFIVTEVSSYTSIPKK